MAIGFLQHLVECQFSCVLVLSAIDMPAVRALNNKVVDSNI